jgi:type I site-specific restriction-modification system R (restriction) subunit
MFNLKATIFLDFTRENYFTNNDQFNKKKSAKAHKKNNLKKNTSKLHKFVSKRNLIDTLLWFILFKKKTNKILLC